MMVINELLTRGETLLNQKIYSVAALDEFRVSYQGWRRSLVAFATSHQEYDVVLTFPEFEPAPEAATGDLREYLVQQNRALADFIDKLRSLAS